jgi:hypothetical protein
LDNNFASTTLKVLSTTCRVCIIKQGKFSYISLSDEYLRSYYETAVGNLPGWNVVFNFCKAMTPKSTGCPQDTFAALVNTNANSTTCYPLAKADNDISASLDTDRSY